MKNSDGKSAPQNHLSSRISYLYQAASYLVEARRLRACELQVFGSPQEIAKLPEQGVSPDVATSTADRLIVLGVPTAAQCSARRNNKATHAHDHTLGLARHLLCQSRAVSLKSQMRLASQVKRSMCKKCNTLLVNDFTSTSGIENRSRGRRKSWADVLVVECNGCHAKKRIPVGGKRQLRKSEREKCNPTVFDQQQKTKISET